MEELKLFIGAKLIQATPMDEETFVTQVKNAPFGTENGSREGYKVIYPDGYVSWSPKEAFESAYREVTEAERELF